MTPPSAMMDLRLGEGQENGMGKALPFLQGWRKAAWKWADDDNLRQVLAYASRMEQQLIEQQQRIAYLESLSVTDELTGLNNRRGLMQGLERVLAEARRYGETGVLAFIDLDHFKTINDHFGHDAGDAVLRHVAMRLSANIRATDLIGRIGGDEFIVILTRTNLENGRRRLRTMLANALDGGVSYNGRQLPVSASSGIVAYGADSQSAALIVEADKAMYRNKKGKRPCLAAE